MPNLIFSARPMHWHVTNKKLDAKNGTEDLLGSKTAQELGQVVIDLNKKLVHLTQEVNRLQHILLKNQAKSQAKSPSPFRR